MLRKERVIKETSTLQMANFVAVHRSDLDSTIIVATVIVYLSASNSTCPNTSHCKTLTEVAQSLAQDRNIPGSGEAQLVQCSINLKSWKSGGGNLENTADDPSAPSPNRSNSCLLTWRQHVALHCLEAK
ncbi:hypothetical protein KIN20_020657 [Parelaphostrongylus tenuis]|uniref:Uncharacterized protein n=1 Tax=Parelaphostrongylus tenuis TaxID=148309 RepID=A0AAD5N664_PARTN|nr:hypothetical protein KIN20_020657 [Parelaphostrongylus tenuis]